MITKALLTLVLSVFAVSAYAATEVDSKAISKALDTLVTLSNYENYIAAKFRVKKVTGATVEAMLRDYATKEGYDDSELKIILRMKASDIPETDGGDVVVGLARNVDLTGIAHYVVSNGDQNTDRNLEKKILAQFFEITKAGGLVGVGSHGWSTCGVTFPSVIILDTATKTVYTLVPTSTAC